MPLPQINALDISPHVNSLVRWSEGVKQQRMQNQLGKLAPQVIAGDQNALTQALAIDPQTTAQFLQIRTANEAASQRAEDRKMKMDDAMRERLSGQAKEAAAYLLNIPEGQEPAAWPTIRQQYPELQLPEAYDPNFRAKAMGILGKVPEAEKPTELMRNLADPATRAYLEAEAARKAQMGEGGGAAPYFTPLQTSSGFFGFNNRTGQVAPLGGVGSPILPVSADVGLASDKAAATARGKEVGESQGQAVAGLGNTIATADRVLSTLDQLRDAPGRKTITGKSAIYGGLMSRIPGTEAADARVLVEQAQGQAFLTAFETLKGGGQITNVEGQKATDAIARLNTAQSDEAFEKALTELRDIVVSARDRAIRKADGGMSPAPAPKGAPQQITTKAQMDALPSGALFIAPDGSTRRKP